MASVCNHYSWLFVLTVGWVCKSSDAFGTFGYDIHHRYSDPVKGILDLNGLPEKGTHDYYAAMAHRDHLLHGRRLAGSGNYSLLTFSTGNDTYRLRSLGFLHYANVSVGTPSMWFLVALDTGSDLLWLPCDCISCVHGLKTRSGLEIDFNIYSPNTSSTSMRIPCNSPECRQRNRCSATSSGCPYQVAYLSNNTSSTGVLVEDVLHLTTDDSLLTPVRAPIKFGCGMIQTGAFLDGAAPNGLFGLGMHNISVPSKLASEGLTSNSFSMCFGLDGIGRIKFGDKGSSDQGETPFNLERLYQTYNISITQLSVGENVTDLEFTAIFDTGTSFTYLNDPAYSVLSESFNTQNQETRYRSDSVPFEYCYNLSNETTIPTVNLTMRGGDSLYVIDPTVIVSLQSGRYIYCLGLVRSGDVNIIGQNFMTGYNIVFDREKMVLGWKASNCYGDKESTTLPINPRNSTGPPPIATFEPQATARNNDGSRNSSPAPPPPSMSNSPRLSSSTSIFFMIVFTISCHYIILSS